MKDLIVFIHVVVVSYLALSISSVSGESSVVVDKENNDDNGGKQQDPTTIGLAIEGGFLLTALSGAATIRGFELQNIVHQEEGKGDDNNNNKQQQLLPAMERFDYISGLSGGILPTVAYCYASDDIKRTELFESDRKISDLAKVTTKELKRFSSKKSFFYRLSVPVVRRVGPNLLWVSMIKPKLVKVLPWLFKDTRNKLWSSVVYKGILKHFGIKKNECISKTPLRKGTRATPVITATFYHPKEGGIDTEAFSKKCSSSKLNIIPSRSFTTLDQVRNCLSDNDNFTYVPLIITPDEVTFGMQQELTVNYNKLDELTTTNEVDPIQYPISSSHPSKWGTKKKPLSVVEAAGMGTNAMAINIPALASIVEAPIKEDGTSRSLVFADGGLLDILGIAGLVHHRVRKIVVSISNTYNYYHNFEASNSTIDDGQDMLFDWLDPPGYDFKESRNLNGMLALASYFGFMVNGSNNYQSPAFSMNNMFADGKARLGELKSKFNSLYLEGNPLVVTLKDLEVIDNPYWGTTAGDMVDLTVIYYANVPKKFSESLKVDGKQLETDKNGFFTDPELSHVPNMKMIGENKLNFKNRFRVAAYTPKEVNMVRILGSWIIQESWDGLRGHDGQVKFEGFKDVFEGKPNIKNSDNDDNNDKTGKDVEEGMKE